MSSIKFEKELKYTMKNDKLITKGGFLMANRIQMARKAQGLTQKEFGEALGLTQATVSAWEVGRNEPNYKVLREIAQVLNCSIEYLMGYTPSETETGVPDVYKRQTLTSGFGVTRVMGCIRVP